MSAFEERLQALRQRFIEQASSDAGAIEQHAASASWSEVRDLSHGIAGRAGMFGFPGLTDQAREMEEAIERGEAPERLCGLARALVSDLREL